MYHINQDASGQQALRWPPHVGMEGGRHACVATRRHFRERGSGREKLGGRTENTFED